MTIQTSSLSDGIRIITDRLEGAESIALGLWVGVGTRHENPTQNGIAHMLEHMLFKGTPTRSAQKISELIEDAGGHMNAYTGRETTAYYIHILKDHTELALDVLSDMILNSTFPDDELERERAVILQEIAMYEDTPDDLVFEKAQAAAYPNQTLGASGLGTPDIVKRLSSADLRDYLNGRYHPSDIVVSAAGAVVHDEFVALAEKYLGGQSSSRRKGPEFLPARYEPTPSLVSKDIEQTHLVLGFRGIAQKDPRAATMRILSNILGGGTSSRLWQEVREKRGLVYSIHSFRESYADDGQFGIYAGTSHENLPELVPIILDEAVKLRREGITDHELHRAKAQIISGARMGREKVMTRVDQQGRHLLSHGTPFDIRDLTEKTNAVTVNDVKALADSVFSTPLLLSAVGDLDSLMPYEEMQNRLKA